MNKLFVALCAAFLLTAVVGCEEGADPTGPTFEAIGPNQDDPGTPTAEVPSEPSVSTDEDCMSNETFYVQKV